LQVDAVRYRATVEYDGCDFLGFQYQGRGRTVQGELEEAIQRVTQQRMRISAAGRTDAGVHAVGQVVAFDVDWRHSVEDLQRALNAVLPADVAIRDCCVTRSDFHPRYDALWRQYRYTVLNTPERSPLARRYAYHVAEALDVPAMRAASRHLIGSHDFAAFGKPTHGVSTVRQVMQADWLGEAPRLVFEVTGNAFLRHMVRTLVGTMVQVGRGQRSPDEVAALLASGDRAAAGPPAPAGGLCLMKIGYAD
jgi:tRNA pseudouridine38-40 synthase